MLILRTLESLVGAERNPPTAAARGFTLLEVQIAIIIFAVAMVGLVGQGRAYRMLLDSIESEYRFEGVALPADDAFVVAVTDAGAGQGAPPCEVRLESLEEDVGVAEAEVTITRRTP